MIFIDREWFSKLELSRNVIDIISAVDGLDYVDASNRAVKMNVDGLEIKVLSLDDLIINKRSSGRPKDIADAMTLAKLREKKNG